MLKKLLAIFLICSLVAPSAIKLVEYAQCSIKTSEYSDDPRLCDCNLSSNPSDSQNSFPEKQKEMLSQTELKYLVEKTDFQFAVIASSNIYGDCSPSFYSFQHISAIFHPPSCSII